MRKFQLTTMFCALFCALSFSSCTDTPETPVDSVTKVTLEQTVVNVVAEGGVFSVDYTVENPLPGIDVVGKTSVEWITSIVTEDGVLKFSVAENGKPEERSAFINVKYPNVDVFVWRFVRQASRVLHSRWRLATRRRQPAHRRSFPRIARCPTLSIWQSLTTSTIWALQLPRSSSSMTTTTLCR